MLEIWNGAIVFVSIQNGPKTGHSLLERYQVQSLAKADVGLWRREFRTNETMLLYVNHNI
ncbi:MAG: hypothetical protein OXC63_04495 [Aestuariivita sp.]|nr:hypothetical protein [Aestuariivita sp.]